MFLIKLVPHLATLSALAIGVSAIRFAFYGCWEKSIWCVFIAGMLDIVDGKLARALKTASSFGVELDSLADLVNFGVTPAIVLYLWHVQCSASGADKFILWLASCFYISCVALRLAKFNVTAHEVLRGLHVKSFFVGVPSTMGAMFMLIPMVISFQLGPMFGISLNHSIFLVPNALCVGILMVSRIPTVGLKSLKIPQEYVWLLCVALVIFFMTIVLYPWYVMPACAVLYLFSLIISPFFYFRQKKD